MLNQANHPTRPQQHTPRPRTLATPRPHTGPVKGFVYLIGIKDHAEYVKIGWSEHGDFDRLRGLQTGNPLLLVGIAERPGTLKDEYNLHVAYEPYNVLGEWFQSSRELIAEFDLTWNQFCAKVEDYYGLETA